MAYGFPGSVGTSVVLASGPFCRQQVVGAAIGLSFEPHDDFTSPRRDCRQESRGNVVYGGEPRVAGTSLLKARQLQPEARGTPQDALPRTTPTRPRLLRWPDLGNLGWAFAQASINNATAPKSDGLWTIGARRLGAAAVLLTKIIGTAGPRLQWDRDLMCGVGWAVARAGGGRQHDMPGQTAADLSFA